MKIRYLKELHVLLCMFTLMIAYAGTASAQEKTAAVTGVVMNERGEYLPGVSVNAQNSKTGFQAGTTTNTEGVFRFDRLPEGGPYSFTFSYVGFEDYKLSPYNIKQGATISLIAKLKDKGKMIEEVVVTGYTKQSKRDVTGAASTVSADVLNKTPVSDVSTALQGRVAGVTVDNQGGPGSAGVVRVRGIGSLGNNDPLYVIDGVQVRVGNSSGSQDIANLINMGNIENITVLKDPSLTAMYGSEGSNGVVIITTKTGKKGEPRLEYNAYVGNQFVTKFPSMVTPQQQADALYNSYMANNSAFPYTDFYGTGKPVLPDYIIQGNNKGVMAGDPAADPALYNFSKYRILQSNKAGTNWWKELFKPAFVQNHNLSISGATDKSNYAVTFGYMDDNGTYLNSYFKRLSLGVNTEFKVKPWLRVGENMNFSYTTSNSISMGFNNDIASLYGMAPLLPTHDIAGNIAGLGGSSVLGGVSNPLITRSMAQNAKNYTEGIIGSAFIEAEPIKGLTYQSKIGVQFVPNQSHSMSDSVMQDPIPIPQTYFREFSSYYSDWRWLNKVGYSTRINNVHSISAFVAYEARAYQYRYLSATVDSLISTAPNFQYISAGLFNPNFPPQGMGDIRKTTSAFGNISYSYMDKYMVTATYRRDGSSQFGANSKYGNFPAASAGWRISQENFMKNISWLNDLKLRASWGKAGNDAIPSGYQYSLVKENDLIYGGYDLGGTNTGAVLGSYPSQTGNANLRWESNVTTNIGFDATAFNNRLTASFNWFNRKTENLLYMPPATGTGGAAAGTYQNIMNFTNKGVELELGYRSGNNGKLRYDMNFNISSYKSNIVYIDGNPDSHIDGPSYAPSHYSLTRNVVGHPVSEFYGYMQEGIFQNGAEYTAYGVTQPGLTQANAAGHFKFKDISGPDGKPDGKVDGNDQTFLGNPNPKFTYGYNVNLYYKDFDFGLFLQGVYGNKIFNYWRAYTEWPGALTAGSLDTWSPTNTGAKLPIYSQDLVYNNNDNVPSSFFVENGSYLRVKNIQLGYTFSKLKGINRLRVYVQAFNMFTVTKFSGLDPEVNTGDPKSLGINYGTQYPMSKKILFGVNLTL